MRSVATTTVLLLGISDTSGEGKRRRLPAHPGGFVQNDATQQHNTHIRDAVKSYIPGIHGTPISVGAPPRKTRMGGGALQPEDNPDMSGFEVRLMLTSRPAARPESLARIRERGPCANSKAESLSRLPRAQAYDTSGTTSILAGCRRC
jgi:hypothetical protein